LTQIQHGKRRTFNRLDRSHLPSSGNLAASSPSQSTASTASPQLTTSQQTPDAQGELTAAVDDLLDQLKHKVDVVSGEMFSKRAFRPSILQLEV
jgi:hypothetical protein